MSGLIDQLRWKKFPVLDDGFVCLVDVMGEDASVVQAAKISYNKDHRGDDSAPGEDNVRTLLRYLMRHRHTTPFEMCEVKFLIRIPMDAWRQMVRHRTANINEYSTRYTEAIDSNQFTNPTEWRLQSESNKQGSGGMLKDTELGIQLSQREKQFHDTAKAVYSERIACGIAREQARKDLPLSTYTEAYWKCDLHNLFHFLGLRMDSHAQLEIRAYANAMASIVQQLFPQCWEAFVDYRLEAVQLSRLDILAIKQLRRSWVADTDDPDLVDECLVAAGITNKREKAECIQKLKLLGLL